VRAARIAITCLSVIVASCATTNLPEYSAPQEGAPYSVVENQGVVGLTTTSCQLLPGDNRICGAELTRVDGKHVSFMALGNRIEPGTHKVRLMCSYWHGGPMFFGGITTITRDLRVELRPGVTYQINATHQNLGCDVNVIEKESGRVVGAELPYGAADEE